MQGVTNDPAVPPQLVAHQLQARRTHARISHSNFSLHKLDELNEVRHSIHAQERQNQRYNSNALSLSPLRPQLNNSTDSRGNALARPAIQPVAPTPIASSTASSTPTEISRRRSSSARIADTRLASVLDSFTASKFSCSTANSRICSGTKSVPYATGLLYSMQERGVARNTVATWVFISRQFP